MTQQTPPLARGHNSLTPLARWTLEQLPPFIKLIPERSPLTYLCARVGITLLAFLVVDFVVRRGSRIADLNYLNDDLISGLLDRFGYGSVLVAGGLAVILIRYGRLLFRWPELDLGRVVQLLAVFLSALIAWCFSTWGYNYYFNSGFAIERVLLVALVPLIYLRPVFLIPFVVIAYTLMWQIAQLPSMGFVFAHKLQILQVLNLLVACILLRAVTGSRRTDMFFFFAFCLLASAYWEPARSKLSIDWLTYGHLYHMPLAAYAHGWFAFDKVDSVVAFAKLIQPFDVWMRWFVIVIEAGCLVLLWKRWLCALFLAAFIGFHLGVFLLYGYFFWTWIALDAAMLAVLLWDRSRNRIPIFGGAHAVLAALLIGLSFLWCNPPRLSWFDTRLSYSYRLEAVGVSGTRYNVPSNFLSPYDDVFSMAMLSYAVDSHRHLVGPYGITKNRQIANYLEPPRSPEEIFEAENRIGVRSYQPEKAQRLNAFLVRFFTNWNQTGPRYQWLKKIAAPPQFWTEPRERTFSGQEKIQELVFREITTLYDESTLREIRTVEVARLAIPATPRMGQ